MMPTAIKLGKTSGVRGKTQKPKRFSKPKARKPNGVTRQILL